MYCMLYTKYIILYMLYIHTATELYKVLKYIFKAIGYVGDISLLPDLKIPQDPVRFEISLPKNIVNCFAVII